MHIHLPRTTEAAESVITHDMIPLSDTDMIPFIITSVLGTHGLI